MTKEIKDKLGYPLNVGDKVIFASGGNQDTRLFTGVITEIVDENNISILKDEGRINTRRGEDILNLMPIMKFMPELFL